MKSRTSVNEHYISNETVQELNEVHGWFQYEDAQSDVSRAFANNAIHAFLHAAKEAEKAKHKTGLSPLQLVMQIEDMQARIDELSKDAAMVDWMQENYLCADFRYGDPVCEVIVIEMPKGSSVCGDLRIDIGNAMKG